MGGGSSICTGKSANGVLTSHTLIVRCVVGRGTMETFTAVRESATTPLQGQGTILSGSAFALTQTEGPKADLGSPWPHRFRFLKDKASPAARRGWPTCGHRRLR